MWGVEPDGLLGWESLKRARMLGCPSHWIRESHAKPSIRSEKGLEGWREGGGSVCFSSIFEAQARS